MWLAMKDGFLSIVESDDADYLKVRSRRREHLEAFIEPLPKELTPEIIDSVGTDYRWRVILERELVAKLVADRVASIDYGNFKASVRDPNLAEMYGRWWQDHYDFQGEDPRNWGVE